MEVACRLVDDLAQLVAGGEVVDGRRTGLCQLSGSGNICERAILVSGNMCILTVLTFYNMCTIPISTEKRLCTVSNGIACFWILVLCIYTC